VKRVLKNLLVLPVFIAAAWLVYGWTLDAPFMLDDQQTIQNNPAIRSLALHEALNPPPTSMGFSRRPVANLSMALNYALGDLRLEGYRVFNLLLHALNAWLLFLLARLVGVRFLALPAGVAWWSAVVAGLLWVVHPLATSAAHYLTQRPEMLAAGAFLAMFYAQARALGSGHPRRWLVAAWAACLLAMGSKESMALLPVLAVLFDRCATSWTWREQWRQRGIFYVLLAATFLWTLWLLAKDSSGVAVRVSLAERWCYFITVAEGIVRHVTLVAWPRGLVFDYGTKLVLRMETVFWPLLSVVVAGGAILWGLRRRSFAAWTGAAVVAVMLPSWINMVPGQPVAEHRFYLPTGLLLALACVAVGVLVARHAFLRRPALAIGAALVLVSGLLAVQRAALYTDPAALMRADIDAWPRGDRTHMNLGLVLEIQENYEDAAAQYRLAAGPWEKANWRPITALARVKLRGGDEREASALADEALDRVLAVPGAPDLLEYVSVLAGSFGATGHEALALPLLRKAAASGLHESFLRNHILQLSAEAGDLEGAKQEFLADAGADPVMRINYAVALARDGREEEAVAELEAMLAEAPENSSPAKIADILALKGAMLGQTAAAAAALEEAVQRNPSHAEALNNLAWLLATAPDDALLDPPRAVTLARKALRLIPHQTSFHGTLAVALAAHGENDEAQIVMENARRLGRVNGDENEELPSLVEKARQRREMGGQD